MSRTFCDLASSDVVPVAGQGRSAPPFKLTHQVDRLFGRGTTDIKGFLTEMLAFGDVVHRRDLKAPFKLLMSYEGEVGCVGIWRIKDRLAPLLGRPSLAIVGEPTKMLVAIGHKGKRVHRADIRGKAGHSALAQILSMRFIWLSILSASGGKYRGPLAPRDPSMRPRTSLILRSTVRAALAYDETVP